MDRTFGSGRKNPLDNARPNRGLATIIIWLLIAGVGGLIWLQSLDPLFGLPLLHPFALAMFGLCFIVGVGYTVAIWLSPTKGSKEDS